MNDEQRKKLEVQTMLGRKVWAKNKLSGVIEEWGTVVDEVYIIVEDYKHLIQRAQSPGEVGSKPEFWYRTGYYTYDKNEKRVVWGQYTQVLGENDYRELLSKAKEKGWPIF